MKTLNTTVWWVSWFFAKMSKKCKFVSDYFYDKVALPGLSSKDLKRIDQEFRDGERVSGKELRERIDKNICEEYGIDITRITKIEVKLSPKLFGVISTPELYIFEDDDAIVRYWDDDLDSFLVTKGIRSISLENECHRFTLRLRHLFGKYENKYGDGIFNSVIVEVARNRFKNHIILKDLPQRSTIASTYADCQKKIEKCLANRIEELITYLRYSYTEAEDILLGALVEYLDRRFCISVRKQIGWS